MEPIYKASKDSDGKPYVKGPCSGGEASYYGGLLYPESRFNSMEEAEKTECFMNMAYKQGYAKAQYDIRKSMGIES